MLRSLKHSHLGAHLRAFKITTSGSTSTVDIGTGSITSSVRNSAGKSTSALHRACVRPGIVIATAQSNAGNGSYGVYNTDVSSANLVCELRDATGSGSDGTAHILMVDYINEFTDRISPAQQVMNSSRSPRLMGFKISSAGAASIGGTQSSSVSKAASIYTTTFRNAFGRAPIVIASPIATAQKSLNITSATASSCAIAAFDSSEVAEDNAFYMIVSGWDSTDMQWGMRRAVQVPQLCPRLEVFNVDGTGTAAIVKGTTDATLVDNGTGDYTLTWNTPFFREPIVVVTGKTTRAQLKTAASTTAATFVLFNATGTATDDKFNVFVLGYDSAMEI